MVIVSDWVYRADEVDWVQPVSDDDDVAFPLYCGRSLEGRISNCKICSVPNKSLAFSRPINSSLLLPLLLQKMKTKRKILINVPRLTKNNLKLYSYAEIHTRHLRNINLHPYLHKSYCLLSAVKLISVSYMILVGKSDPPRKGRLIYHFQHPVVQINFHVHE